MKQMKLNPRRLKEIESFHLERGNHASLKEGACVMELVSYLANEPWSDHPKCTCPMLTGYAIALNDRFTNEHRQRLKPFISALIGTSTHDNNLKIARVRLLRWRFVTATYPAILDYLEIV